MSVTATNSVTQNGSTSSTDTAKAKLVGDYSTFIKLLAAQVQNQDPLSPMDSSKFTEQLVQYSQVEQSIGQNSRLDKLIGLQQDGRLSFALGYIGKTVEIADDTASHSGKGISWSYQLPDNVKETALTIVDSKGKVVYSGDGSTSSGRNSFAWNGKDNQGNLVPNGTYTLKVAPKDATGADLEAIISVGGIVSGVESGKDGPQLVVNGSRLPADSVVAVTSGS